MVWANLVWGDRGGRKHELGQRQSSTGSRRSLRPRARRVTQSAAMVQEQEKPQRRWRYPLLAVSVVFAPLLLFAADQKVHSGRVWRGVRAESVKLAGLDEAAARSLLAEAGARIGKDKLVVSVAGKSTSIELGELGYALDADATWHAAMAARREPGARQLLSWFAGFFGEREVPLSGTLDLAKIDLALERWERELVVLPFEGAVTVKDGAPVGEAPRAGQVVDRQAARDALGKLVSTSERNFVLPVVDRQPLRSATALQTALERARAVVQAPIVLYLERSEIEPAQEKHKEQRKKPSSGAKARAAAAAKERGRPLRDPSGSHGRDVGHVKGTQEEPPDDRIAVTFSREQLVAALGSRLSSEPPAIEIYLDGEAVDAALTEVRKVVEAPSLNPHFAIDARDKPYIVPGRAGRVLKTEAVARALLAAAGTAERTGKLPLEPGDEPTVTIAELEALGITGLVSKFTSMHPCCMPRVDNIHRIADLVSGVVVKPGEQFSVNEHVGPRTTDKGFKAAPTIVYGEMEDTVGGGISQFATTLFNAAFHGGYDIVERTPHSYYFPRYPMGHEATLSFPKPDLIVRNDTRAGLWIHCSYTPTSITVKLFGDNAGRRVRRKVSKVRDVTRPPLEYLADAALDPDEEKVRERGQVGWTVVVSRIIEFADGTSRTEERKVVYQPRVRRVRVHPCKIPEGEKGYTGERCPEQEEAEAQADAHGDGEAATGAPSDVEGHAIDSAEDEG